MYEILRIKKTSLARSIMLVVAVLHIVVGLLVTLLYSGVRTIGLDGILSTNLGVWSFFLVWLTGLIVLVPLSFLLGLLAAAVYNLTAHWWGGVKIDLAKVDAPMLTKESGRTAHKKQYDHA